MIPIQGKRGKIVSNLMLRSGIESPFNSLPNKTMTPNILKLRTIIIMRPRSIPYLKMNGSSIKTSSSAVNRQAIAEISSSSLGIIPLKREIPVVKIPARRAPNIGKIEKTIYLLKVSSFLEIGSDRAKTSQLLYSS